VISRKLRFRQTSNDFLLRFVVFDSKGKKPKCNLNVSVWNVDINKKTGVNDNLILNLNIKKKNIKQTNWILYRKKKKKN
jgi:hypothetical protein